MVRPKPDRMRSKVTGLCQRMVIVGSFDLISQPLRAASFSSRRSLPPPRRFLRMKFGGRGMPRPYSALPGGVIL